MTRNLKCVSVMKGWWQRVVKFESQNLHGAGFSRMYKFVSLTNKNYQDVPMTFRRILPTFNIGSLVGGIFQFSNLKYFHKYGLGE
jgi:hypothetical protein